MGDWGCGTGVSRGANWAPGTGVSWATDEELGAGVGRTTDWKPDKDSDSSGVLSS